MYLRRGVPPPLLLRGPGRGPLRSRCAAHLSRTGRVTERWPFRRGGCGRAPHLLCFSSSVWSSCVFWGWYLLVLLLAHVCQHSGQHSSQHNVLCICSYIKLNGKTIAALPLAALRQHTNISYSLGFRGAIPYNHVRPASPPLSLGAAPNYWWTPRPAGDPRGRRR